MSQIKPKTVTSENSDAYDRAHGGGSDGQARNAVG